MMSDMPGINADRLEQMEMRLKLEIIREASLNNNLLLLHDELRKHSIVDSCEFR